MGSSLGARRVLKTYYRMSHPGVVTPATKRTTQSILIQLLTDERKKKGVDCENGSVMLGGAIKYAPRIAKSTTPVHIKRVIWEQAREVLLRTAYRRAVKGRGEDFVVP